MSPIPNNLSMSGGDHPVNVTKIGSKDYNCHLGILAKAGRHGGTHEDIEKRKELVGDDHA